MIESVDIMSEIYELEQIRQPKLHLRDVPVKITGVYRHIFQVEETSSGQPKHHALQYADVLTHDIELLNI